MSQALVVSGRKPLKVMEGWSVYYDDERCELTVQGPKELTRAAVSAESDSPTERVLFELGLSIAQRESRRRLKSVRCPVTGDDLATSLRASGAVWVHTSGPGTVTVLDRAALVLVGQEVAAFVLSPADERHTLQPQGLCRSWEFLEGRLLDCPGVVVSDGSALCSWTSVCFPEFAGWSVLNVGGSMQRAPAGSLAVFLSRKQR